MQKNKNKTCKSHPAILEPNLWWKYEKNLNADLVVITPSIEGDTGLDSAGDLPLAEDPKYPDAKKKFLCHLREEGTLLGQQAMLQAMAIEK